MLSEAHLVFIHLPLADDRCCCCSFISFSPACASMVLYKWKFIWGFHTALRPFTQLKHKPHWENEESELLWLLIRPHFSRTAIIYLYLKETKRLCTKRYRTTKPEESPAFLLTKFSQPKRIDNEVHRFPHTLNRPIKVDLSAPFPLNYAHALPLQFSVFCEIMLLAI